MTRRCASSTTSSTFRVALERQMTRDAAERMTDTQLEALGDALARLERMLDSTEEYLDADGEFHDMILIGSGISSPVDHSINPPVRAREHALPRSNHDARTPCDVSPRSRRDLPNGYERATRKGPAPAMQDHIMQSWIERKARTK